MIIAFTLTMPGTNSWNGRWSGDEFLNARTRTLPNSQKARDKAKALTGSHYYNWPDGWAACVRVEIVDAAEARRIRRKTRGFAGYDWMIDSLLWCGEIRSHSDAVKS